MDAVFTPPGCELARLRQKYPPTPARSSRSSDNPTNLLLLTFAIVDDHFPLELVLLRVKRSVSTPRCNRCKSARISDASHNELGLLLQRLADTVSNSGSRSGFSLRAETGCRFNMASTMTEDVSPRNVGTPVPISYSTAPKENRSVRASSSFPKTCSGTCNLECRQAILEPSVGSRDWLSRPGIALRDFCQAKIEYLRVTTFGDKDVCRLNVPMNDALAVCRIKRVCDLGSQIEYHSVSSGRPAMWCFNVTPSKTPCR